MRWCCASSCCQADAVVIDAHANQKPPAGEAITSNGHHDDDDAEAQKSQPEAEASRRQELSICVSAPLEVSTSSLYYFDAQEEEEEEEEEDFFDAVSETFRGELAVLLREDTVEDYLLLDPSYRDSACSVPSRKRVSVKSEEWGFPGALNEKQLAAYQDFRAQIQDRGGTYREMVYCYQELEPESFALCRFLRSCNFNTHRTLKYMQEYFEPWQEAKKHNFYPDANVGCPLSVLLTQFPSLYTGYAKEGFPVCYFHSGSLSVEGIECVTDLERLPNFLWYTMMHDIRRIYADAIARNPTLGRLEQITVMNLDGLSPNLMTPQAYAVSQQADAVAQAFPEMLHKLIILNAPSFFTMLWKTFKYLLDANTTKRIEIYSSAEKGMARLKELIDERELPSDYGGLAISTSERILREGRQGPVPKRQIVELMTVKRRREANIEFELANDEEISIDIYTRSTSCTEFSLLDEQDRVVKRIEVTTKSETMPYCVKFVKTKGPGQFSVHAQHSKESPSIEHFLVVGEVFVVNKVE